MVFVLALQIYFCVGDGAQRWVLSSFLNCPPPLFETKKFTEPGTHPLNRKSASPRGLSPALDYRCLQRSLHIVSGDWTHTLMPLSWLCQLPSPKNCSLKINTLFRTPLFFVSEAALGPQSCYACVQNVNKWPWPGPTFHEGSAIQHQLSGGAMGCMVATWALLLLPGLGPNSPHVVISGRPEIFQVTFQFFSTATTKYLLV